MGAISPLSFRGAAHGPQDWEQTMFPEITRDEVFRIETMHLWLRWPVFADAEALAHIVDQDCHETSSSRDAAGTAPDRHRPLACRDGGGQRAASDARAERRRAGDRHRPCRTRSGPALPARVRRRDASARRGGGRSHADHDEMARRHPRTARSVHGPAARPVSSGRICGLVRAGLRRPLPSSARAGEGGPAKRAG